MEDKPLPITNLENVTWVDEGQSLSAVARNSGAPVAKMYVTFQDAYDAISAGGPIVVGTPQADIIFFIAAGRFGDCIIAVRQSGVNVRRFLIEPGRFEDTFGDFQGCIDHLISHNTPEAILEVTHLRDLHKQLLPNGGAFPDNHNPDRLRIDLIAAVQLLELYQELFGEVPETDLPFAIGFSVGRLFSSAQNLATLEDKAIQADRYKKSYRERGRKGKSSDIKAERADAILSRMEQLQAENPAFGRLQPKVLGGLALEDCAKSNPSLWTQGMGQLDNYLTLLASDRRFKARFDRLFF